MENAVKALLIAAGVLLAIMIVSMLVMGYNGISSHYQQQQEILTAEQLDKFNKQFQNYNRGEIRGNELISLMNKVIDYNASQSYLDGTEYEPIKMTIKIQNNNSSLVGELKYVLRYEINGITYETIYGTDIISNSGVITNITQTGGTDYLSDRSLIAITETPAQLITLAKDSSNNSPSLIPINSNIDITEVQLQKLTADITNIIFNENTSGMDDRELYRLSENRRNRAIILKNVLKFKIGVSTATNSISSANYDDYDIVLDAENNYNAVHGEERITKVKNIVSQYYQYTQFKRAFFNCTSMGHNTETGRINSMVFEVQTKVVDGTTTIVFD